MDRLRTLEVLKEMLEDLAYKIETQENKDCLSQETLDRYEALSYAFAAVSNVREFGGVMLIWDEFDSKVTGTELPEEGDIDEMPKPEDLTCFKCSIRSNCEFADDPYNTDGDCLALK